MSETKTDEWDVGLLASPGAAKKLSRKENEKLSVMAARQRKMIEDNKKKEEEEEEERDINLAQENCSMLGLTLNGNKCCYDNKCIELNKETYNKVPWMFKTGIFQQDNLDPQETIKKLITEENKEKKEENKCEEEGESWDDELGECVNTELIGGKKRRKSKRKKRRKTRRRKRNRKKSTRRRKRRGGATSGEIVYIKWSNGKYYKTKFLKEKDGWFQVKFINKNGKTYGKSWWFEKTNVATEDEVEVAKILVSNEIGNDDGARKKTKKKTRKKKTRKYKKRKTRK